MKKTMYHNSRKGNLEEELVNKLSTFDLELGKA